MLCALCGAAGVPGSHMAGHIVLTGRAKDTIVLASGENVEPAPIEDALALSPFIAGVVLVGQDARMLGALVVPSPEAFQELEAVRGEPYRCPCGWRAAALCACLCILSPYCTIGRCHLHPCNPMFEPESLCQGLAHAVLDPRMSWARGTCKHIRYASQDDHVESARVDCSCLGGRGMLAEVLR